jgi:hypothetical protein
MSISSSAALGVTFAVLAIFVAIAAALYYHSHAKAQRAQAEATAIAEGQPLAKAKPVRAPLSTAPPQVTVVVLGYNATVPAQSASVSSGGAAAPAASEPADALSFYNANPLASSTAAPKATAGGKAKKGGK